MFDESREYRSSSWTAEESGKHVSGYALTFDQPYELFRDKSTGIIFYEIIERNALDSADFSDMHLNIDHSGRVYARTRNGSLKYQIDSHGLFIDANLSGSSEGESLYNDVKTGLYDRMSFAFAIDAEYYDESTHTRHITRIDKVYDVAAVATPANPNTELHARSMAEYVESERRTLRNRENVKRYAAIEEILDEFEIRSHNLADYDDVPDDIAPSDTGNYRDLICKRMLLARVNARLIQLSTGEIPQSSVDEILSLKEEWHNACDLRKETLKNINSGCMVGRAVDGSGLYIPGHPIFGTPTNITDLRKVNYNIMENTFYNNLIEKRSAAGTSGMSNIIPQEIVSAKFRSGVNGFMPFISQSHIANGGSVKIPYVADSDVTVSAHTENAAITPNNLVPSVVTITHSELQETLGYSYLGMKLAVSDLREIVEEGLLNAMQLKLDAVAVAAAKSLTWVKTAGPTKNAVQWASSGNPTISELLELAGLLKARYTQNARFFMNQKTCLSIIANSTGTAYKASDDSAASNGLYNVNIADGLTKIFGIPVSIDSNMSDGDVLYGDPSAVHMNFASDGVELSNWLDRDNLTEKFQVACAAGAGVETAAFVFGANSIS